MSSDAYHAARLQAWQWLDHVERVTIGIHHERAPTVRRGQWVRFIGRPDSVVTPDPSFCPQVGSYGQVFEVQTDRQHPAHSRAHVLFVGCRGLIRLSIMDVEPLVGTPIGQPRHLLREFRRGMAARWRDTQTAV